MNRKDSQNETDAGRRTELVTGAILAACMLLVGAWLVLSRLAAGPFDAYSITAASFDGFAPVLPGFDLRNRDVHPDPLEPNILIYEITARGKPATDHAAGPVVVRLVHGYNMPDCMRIKGYRVELAGKSPGGDGQVWRLTSSTGDVGIWITSMLRASDLGYSGADVRSMAFPKIDVPDEPGWVPTGITWADMQHPVTTFKQITRAKWNGARCDVLTFLRLKKPAIPDDHLLTLVSAWQGPSVDKPSETGVIDLLSGTHHGLCSALQSWQSSRK